MYRILPLLILLSCASPKYTASEPIQPPVGLNSKIAKDLLQFKRSYTVEGHTKAELYQLAQIWANSYLVYPSQAITYINQEAGIISGKYTTTGTLEYLSSFTIQVTSSQVVLRISNPTTKKGQAVITKDLSEARAKLIIQSWQQTATSLQQSLKEGFPASQ